MNKFWIRFISSFILNRENRSEFRLRKLEELYKKERAKARWGVSYSVFDGEELLKPSILNIRKSVDYVNVVYQKHSWYGNPADEKLKEKLDALKEEGLIDELIEYMPNYNKSAGQQEREKRNLGLAAAKKNRVNYFMTMDVDKFYFASEFEAAKNIIIERAITQSFVPICNYGYSPRKKCLNYSNEFVPFFAKIRKGSKLDKNPKTPCFVDKTRKFGHSAGEKYYLPEGIYMHHMSLVRRSVKSKFINSSTPRDDIEKLSFDKIFSSCYADVDDYFGIEPFLGYEKSAL